MDVIETTLGTGPHSESKPGLLFRVFYPVLKSFIPAANPDFDDLYGDVRKWWVEIDSEGVPQREIGFDRHGAVILAGPVGENLGFWTDSAMTFKAVEHPIVAPDLFEEKWRIFEDRCMASHPPVDFSK